ncbi:MAG: T9SS type A sorting domain-containing protein [Bacteroidota bacterium]|nr:T9SS type A sorting domain-containing protein [Bacteroidota bacterium]
MTYSIHLIILLIYLCVTIVSSQELSVYDGELGELTCGFIYTLDADPNSDNPLDPPWSGGWGAPLRVVLKAPPGTQWQINFIAPDSARSVDGTAIPCSFAPDGVFWEEQQIRWNPKLPKTISVGPESIATFHLGIVIDTRTINKYNNFQATIRCLAIDIRTEEILLAPGKFYIQVQSRVDPNQREGELNNLSRGTIYTVSPFSPTQNLISPIRNGREAGKPAMVSIITEQRETLFVKFDYLPENLIGETGAKIRCSFTDNAVYWHEGKKYLNPYTGDTITSGDDGVVTISIGITVAIPETTSAGEYVGIIYMKILMKELAWVSGNYFFVIVDEVPENFKLYSNYPNPFNTSTKIRYDLPENSHVLIQVFNLVGQEIITLKDELQKANSYEIEWNAIGFPSGVYFYRLKVGDNLLSGKMSLIK